jgi:pimeloyl-ACP methyl ester carboxylesterase
MARNENRRYSPGTSGASKRFVLVHGGMHGGWCWEYTIQELRRAGHDAVAITWPLGERTPAGAPTFGEIRSPVLEVLRPGDVLVGHSMGCYVITLAANEAPDLVAHMIYLAGPLIVEGAPAFVAMGGSASNADESRVQTRDAEGADRYIEFIEDGRLIWFNFEGARQVFYHDCTPEMARWAHERMKPMRVDRWFNEPMSVPQFWSADIPRSYIACTEDQALPLPIVEEQCRRLGVVPLHIRSSHSPFLSCPRQLADLLVKATNTAAIGPLQAAPTEQSVAHHL